MSSPALFDLTATGDEPLPNLPVLTPREEVYRDYQTVSLSLRAHPLSFHRCLLTPLGIVPCGDLAKIESGQRATIAGLVLLRQRPGTAKGITFVTLEDETGTANLVVHQATWERFRRITRHASAWIAQGKVEAKDSVIHLIVERIEDLTQRIEAPRSTSRDFR